MPSKARLVTDMIRALYAPCSCGRRDMLRRPHRREFLAAHMCIHCANRCSHTGVQIATDAPSVLKHKIAYILVEDATPGTKPHGSMMTLMPIDLVEGPI